MTDKEAAMVWHDAWKDAITVNDDDVHSIKADKPRYFIGERELTCDEAWEWIQDAIDTKAKRFPDPATGLMPCWCGGKPKMDEWDDNGNKLSVTCPNCTIQIVTIGDGSTEHGRQATRSMWNRAMGYSDA